MQQIGRNKSIGSSAIDSFHWTVWAKQHKILERVIKKAWRTVRQHIEQDGVHNNGCANVYNYKVQ